MNEIQSPILSIPGFSYGLGSVIISGIGDIHRFNTPSQLLAFAGLEASRLLAMQDNTFSG